MKNNKIPKLNMDETLEAILSLKFPIVHDINRTIATEKTLTYYNQTVFLHNLIVELYKNNINIDFKYNNDLWKYRFIDGYSISYFFNNIEVKFSHKRYSYNNPWEAGSVFIFAHVDNQYNRKKIKLHSYQLESRLNESIEFIKENIKC